MLQELRYGPVVVTEGPEEGRIGYYDDDIEDEDSDGLAGRDVECASVALVYFGTLDLSDGYADIPKRWLKAATTNNLMRRKTVLEEICNVRRLSEDSPVVSDGDRLAFMFELHYVESELVRRLIQARYIKPTKRQKIFISHSSSDNKFARWLWSDLKAAGHDPWIDEDEIKVGQSITRRIAEGVREADFLVLILSKHAVESQWVEAEWHSRYWDEINSGTTLVLPVLYQPCAIPEFLKFKKYADFSLNYNDGLEDLL